MLEEYEVVVMGASAGGAAALAALFSHFPAAYPLPLVVVQHLHPLQTSAAPIYLDSECTLTIKEAEEKEPIEPGHAYFAPPNYHLLIEDDRSFSLSVDERVNFVRPSVDVLFESAVDAYGPHLIGVILTGANHDGAQGLRLIKENGGLTIVQDPATAEAPYMPQAALRVTQVDYVLPLAEIGQLLAEQSWRSRR